MFALTRLRLPTIHPTPYRINPCYYSNRKTSKTRGVQIACRIISYENTSYVIRISILLSLAWLCCTITEPQLIQFFKSVFLKILNVPIRSFFQNQVTYDYRLYLIYDIITIYGKTFEGENFCSCAQNTLFTGKLSWCIRPMLLCSVHGK